MLNIIAAISAILLLILLASILEARDSHKDKSATTISSDKKQRSECFADFLVLQLGEKTQMRGKNKQFFVDIKSVRRVKMYDFMQENEGKTAELWNCVNRARPFPQSNLSGGQQTNLLADLMDAYRLQISKMGTIAPSDYVQVKLQNAQCLLDLGVIEGKILTKSGKIFFDVEEQVEWFKELEEAKEPVLVSAEGAAHLDKCLHKGKPFDVKLAKSETGGKHLLQLDGIDRKDLVRHCYLTPFSEWLIKKIDVNLKQKQCFADLFILHLGVQTSMRERQFIVLNDYFPGQDAIAALNAKEMQPFVGCINRASPFKKYFANCKQMDNLIADFYDQNNAEIMPSEIVQRKLHNAQCWLDLGALEGKIKTKRERLNENYLPGEMVPWLEELDSDKPIVVSPDGAAHLQDCLHKGKPFEAKLDENRTAHGEMHQWHLQLLDTAERRELLKTFEQITFSLWLYEEDGWEQSCVAAFLIREEFAQTTLDPVNPQWRMIVWDNNDDERKWPAQIHANNHPDKFEKLRSCIFRKAAMLKMDTEGKHQYFGLEPLFKLTAGHIYVNSLVNKELDTQSDCLARFLVIKSGVKCLLKKKTGPTGELLNLDFTDEAPFRPYIINFGDKEWAYALSAEKCHLPEGETGIYIEDSEVFKQLKDCDVKMTTTEHEGGKAIDVRKLLQLYVPTQMYLRGIPIELLPTTTVKEDRTNSLEIDCAFCQESFVEDDVIVILPCPIKSHHFHRHCIQNWIKNSDSCPICRSPILIDVPYCGDSELPPPPPPEWLSAVPTATTDGQQHQQK